MKWRRAAACAAALVGVLALARAEAAVTVEKIEYHGWQGAYRMANGTVDLVFVPWISRIMRYGFIGGPNVLWENPELAGKTPDANNPSTDWINYGGDKLWNAPQARWGWPPDPVIDRGTCDVTVMPGGRLRITGQFSAKFGLRFQRDITLAAQGDGVTLRNRLISESKQPISWSIWEIAQVDHPELLRLARSETSRFPGGYHAFADFPALPEMLTVTGTEIAFRRSATRSAKIGSDAADGWIKARFPGQEFTMSSAVETGMSYPDDGCAQEVYVNQDPLQYAEMELLGPIHDIRPGKIATFVTHWNLKRLR